MNDNLRPVAEEGIRVIERHRGSLSSPPPLPDAIIETLRQLQGDAERHQWEIGDYLQEVVDELEQTYTRLGVKRARTFLIRHMANRVGADESTLRDRECVARFFPKEAREEYPFTWSQWRVIKSAGDNWKQYADWAAENLPAPVSVIRQKIKANGHEAPKWIYKWEKAMDFLEDIADDETAPGKVRSFAGSIIKSRDLFREE